VGGWFVQHPGVLGPTFKTEMPMRAELGQPFHAIRKLATEALAMLKQDPGFDDTVNWADLRVVSVEFYETDAATCGYRVYIEEASPGASKFAGAVHEYLLRHGFINVHVVTEW